MKAKLTKRKRGTRRVKAQKLDAEFIELQQRAYRALQGMLTVTIGGTAYGLWKQVLEATIEAIEALAQHRKQ